MESARCKAFIESVERGSFRAAAKKFYDYAIRCIKGKWPRFRDLIRIKKHKKRSGDFHLRISFYDRIMDSKPFFAGYLSITSSAVHSAPTYIAIATAKMMPSTNMTLPPLYPYARRPCSWRSESSNRRPAFLFSSCLYYRPESEWSKTIDFNQCD